MGPLTSSYVLCGSREANEGKLFELTGELTLTLSLLDLEAGGESDCFYDCLPSLVLLPSKQKI